MVMAFAICSPRSPASLAAYGSRNRALPRSVSRARNTAAQRAVSEISRIRGSDIPWGVRSGESLATRKARVALRLELRPWLPLREGVGLRDDIADSEESAHVLHTAREIPVRLHLVRRLVVVARGILVAFFHAIAARLADEIDAGIGVERRNALFRKLEMIRPVVETLFGLSVGTHRATVRFQNAREIIVERRVAEADHGEVARLSPLIDAVHVDVRRRLRERKEWMLSVVLRSDEALLFRGDGQEQNRALRGLREFLEGGGDV